MFSVLFEIEEQANDVCFQPEGGRTKVCCESSHLAMLWVLKL